MSNIFKLDQKSLKDFQKIQDSYPRKFNFMSASVLTNQAWALKNIIPEVLDKNFEIRNKGFARSSVRVEKANGRIPINRQFSLSGSIERKGFTGWEEQQTGTRSEKDTVTTEAARGGSWGGKVKRGVRTDRSGKFKKSSDFRKKGRGYNHKTRGQQVYAMIKSGKNKPSQKHLLQKSDMFGRFSNFKNPGMFVGGERVQTFGKSWSPKRVDWMGQSVRQLDRQFNLKGSWKKAFDFQFRNMK